MAISRYRIGQASGSSGYKNALPTRCSDAGTSMTWKTAEDRGDHDKCVTAARPAPRHHVFFANDDERSSRARYDACSIDNIRFCRSSNLPCASDAQGAPTAVGVTNTGTGASLAKHPRPPVIRPSCRVLSIILERAMHRIVSVCAH